MKGWMNIMKDFWLKYEPKIILVLGFVLVAVLSFEAGMLKGQKTDQKPIIIEKSAIASTEGDNAGKNAPGAQNSASGASEVSGEINIPAQNHPILKQDCVFVGSKNSNKYHLPTCQFAKRIKPENIVCFKSIEDAVSKGYQPDKGCVK